MTDQSGRRRRRRRAAVNRTTLFILFSDSAISFFVFARIIIIIIIIRYCARVYIVPIYQTGRYIFVLTTKRINDPSTTSRSRTRPGWWWIGGGAHVTPTVHKYCRGWTFEMHARVKCTEFLGTVAQSANR